MHSDYMYMHVHMHSVCVPAVFLGDFFTERILSRSPFFTLSTCLTPPTFSCRATGSKDEHGTTMYHNVDWTFAMNTPLTFDPSSSPPLLGLFLPSPRRALCNNRPPPFSLSCGLCVCACVCVCVTTCFVKYMSHSNNFDGDK